MSLNHNYTKSGGRIPLKIRFWNTFNHYSPEKKHLKIRISISCMCTHHTPHPSYVHIHVIIYLIYSLSVFFMTFNHFLTTLVIFEPEFFITCSTVCSTRWVMVNIKVQTTFPFLGFKRLGRFFSRGQQENIYLFGTHGWARSVHYSFD